MPFFSVIIPTHNASHTLEKCLDSVLNQTYKDVEIIIMDACSSDSTLTIIREKAKEYKNIKWVSEKDGGIYDAMNKGVAQASGEWLYFLGSDDFLYDSEVFSDIVTETTHYKPDVIYGDAVVTSDGSRHGGVFSLDTLLFSHNLCHQTVFYSKRVFDIIGSYNLKYPLIADWEYNIRCFSDGHITKHYVERKIVLFNDVTGISSMSKNDFFYRMIPATYIKEIEALKEEIEALKKRYDAVINSGPYTMGTFLYDIMEKCGLVKIVAMLRKNK